MRNQERTTAVALRARRVKDRSGIFYYGRLAETGSIRCSGFLNVVLCVLRPPNGAIQPKVSDGNAATARFHSQDSQHPHGRFPTDSVAKLALTLDYFVEVKAGRQSQCWRACERKCWRRTWSWCAVGWCFTPLAMPAEYPGRHDLVVIKPSGVPLRADDAERFGGPPIWRGKSWKGI